MRRRRLMWRLRVRVLLVRWGMVRCWGPLLGLLLWLLMLLLLLWVLSLLLMLLPVLGGGRGVRAVLDGVPDEDRRHGGWR